MQWLKRPVILLGSGARGADMEKLISLGIPILTSWPAKDSIDNYHQHYFGSPGIYGTRVANKVLHHADQVLAIGNRLSIWNVGYDGIRKDQELIQVELDAAEIRPEAVAIKKDAREFVAELPEEGMAWNEWLAQCILWREGLPLVERAHEDSNGYINSYRFVQRLQDFLKYDEIIVTEMGAALCSAFQVLRLKPPQRLMTSGGLGEMGCGLPAAIGAAFAKGGRVLCFSTDGGMMLNLQELQTIVHHQLSVKIIVFNNSGYGMLRETQEKAGMRLSGVNERTGVSFPNFRHIALAFGISACEIRDWADFERLMPFCLNGEGPCLIEYHMDPNQPLIPKLDPIYVDGKPRGRPFDQMSPII